MILAAIDKSFLEVVLKNKEKSGGELALIALGGLVGVAAGVGIGMGVLSNLYPIFQTDKWAAWVQAIGSVFAIIASVSLMFWQIDHQKKQRRTSEREEVEAVVKNILKFINSLDGFADDFMEKRKKEGYNDRTNYENSFKIWYDGLCEIKSFNGIITEIHLNLISLRSSALYLIDIAKKYGNKESLSEESVMDVLLMKGNFEYSRINISEFVDKFNLDVEVELKGFPPGVAMKDGIIHLESSPNGFV